METASRQPLTVDVVSDAVCPWCYIGKRKLDTALSRIDELPVTVVWRPFQLDPTIPQGGISRDQYLTRKFGPDRAADMHARLEQAGAEVGIAFAFDRIRRSPNTLDAHRILRWTLPTGHQSDIVERLFSLYFVEGEDIGDRDILAEVAATAGLDRAEIRRQLDSNLDLDAVSGEVAEAQRIGVTGVPFFIFAHRLAVSGAQPAQVLEQGIRQAALTPAP